MAKMHSTHYESRRFGRCGSEGDDPKPYTIGMMALLWLKETSCAAGRLTTHCFDQVPEFPQRCTHATGKVPVGCIGLPFTSWIRDRVLGLRYPMHDIDWA